MALSRYSFINKITYAGKTVYATNTNSAKIFNGVDSGNIQVKTHILSEGQRLDSLAGLYYNNSSYWWVIASASGIGWPLQVPPGAFLRIPINLDEVFRALV
jgi:hypothetical protein